MILTLRFYEITANKFNKQVGKMEYLSGMLRRKASYRKRFALEKNRLFHQPVADQSIRFHRTTFRVTLWKESSCSLVSGENKSLEIFFGEEKF